MIFERLLRNCQKPSVAYIKPHSVLCRKYGRTQRNRRFRGTRPCGQGLVCYTFCIYLPREKVFCVYTISRKAGAAKKQKAYQLSAFFLFSLGRPFSSSVPNALKIFCTFSSILPADFTTFAIVALICSGVSFVTS